jgi:hypothetical protein
VSGTQIGNADQPTGEEVSAGPAPATAWWRRALDRRRAALATGGEEGMSTAEYAVGTVAACAFAAVLYRVVSGDSIVSGLTSLIDSALATLS